MEILLFCWAHFFSARWPLAGNDIWRDKLDDTTGVDAAFIRNGRLIFEQLHIAVCFVAEYHSVN